jgi:hypothetical protein
MIRSKYIPDTHNEGFMRNLKQNRTEIRGQVRFDPDHPPIDTSKLEKEKFDNPVSNTIYLGFPAERLPDGTHSGFPDGFAFRIRFYNDSEPSRDGVEVLDKDQKCYLEIKHKIEGQSSSRQKVRHLTTVGEAIDIAQSKNKVLNIFSKDLSQDMIQKLETFYDHEGTCQPLTSVSYRRTHYKKGSKDLHNYRVTLDSDIRSVPIVKYDGVWFLGKAILLPNSVIEIKKHASEKPSPEANISKFKISQKAVNQAVHFEPGMNMSAEGYWVLTEQEFKINTVNDPRPTLHILEGTDNILLGPSKKGSSMMQFIVIGDNGICIMGRKDITTKMAIKIKENEQVRDGVIIKNETVMPYTEEDLARITKIQGGSIETVNRTAYFTRNRAMRLVICKDTGNIFAITADKCVSEDGRPDLNQVEIEYRGKITAPDQTEENQDEIDADFKQVSNWLFTQLRQKRQVPESTLLTKYEWSSSDVIEQKLPEQFGQGNNARIELEGAEVVKTYDVLCAQDSAYNIKVAYDEFHKQVAKVYKVPELYSTEADGNSLVVREAMIEGDMGSVYLKKESEDEIAGFIYQVLGPLVGQIMVGSDFKLEEGKHSKLPLKTPMDLKPDNFIVNSNRAAVFVDMFPPLNRQADGGLFETYPIKSGKHEAWVYGESSVLITRFLMRCLRDRPDKTKVITIAVLAMVAQIDTSGLLLAELKVNANRDKTITDFNEKVPTYGNMALNIIRDL